tara:strand:+ start:547 stop:999 length:453 start_codon:yes stop_codon:yes gene_type:complete
VIDISKSSPAPTSSLKKQLPKPSVNLLLALALAWVVYDTSYWKKLVPAVVVPAEVSAQVLFVTSESMSPGQGQASISMKVDEFCEKNGIERRRLEVGQDTSGAETWLQEMAEIGYGQAPSIVFRSKAGRLDCIPIPDSIDATISEIRSRT